MTALAQSICTDYSEAEMPTAGKGSMTECLWRVALAAGKPVPGAAVGDVEAVHWESFVGRRTFTCSMQHFS